MAKVLSWAAASGRTALSFARRKQLRVDGEAITHGNRFTLGTRLLVVLCTVAGFSTTMALVMQDSSLSADLHRVAQERLERATEVAQRLIGDHVDELSKRFAAISGTPQFVANLETEDVPTLTHFARSLAERHGASAVVFAGEDGVPIAATGSLSLQAKALEQLDGPGRTTAVLHHAGAPHAAARVPLSIADKPVGYLFATERITPEKLDYVSQVCGALISTAEKRDPDLITRPLRTLGDAQFNASVSMSTERAALSNSRQTLLAAGLAALLLAFALSWVMTRGLVRPILAIQQAADRIGRGDLEFRLDANRNDEVGDVSRAFNSMLDRIERTQGRLTNAQRLARIANWGIDARSSRVFGSDEFTRIYGLDASGNDLDLQEIFRRIHPDDRTDFESGVLACLNHGKLMRLDHRAFSGDGAERVLHTTVERVSSGDLEGTVQDITDRKEIEGQIRYLAYHDSLTGLGNRRFLTERLGMALESSRRSQSKVAVLSLDVDRFNAINDTLGHAAGDELLVEVAGRLTSSVRVSGRSLSLDQEDQACVVARLGGDEFTILLTDVQDRADIDNLAEGLLQTFADPFELDGQDVVMNASIGIAMGPEDADDAETLIRNSDVAMSHAKNHGAGRYHFYTDTMQADVAKRLTLENKLYRAIHKNQFELHYQPKLDMHTGKVHGVEALIRWHDPEIGTIPPDEFLPLAEETGLILEIGEWVLRTAMVQAVEWQSAGFPLRVAVNVSVNQMEDRLGFLHTIVKLLDETGLDPQRLDLEITESTLIRDEETAVALLQKLRDIGLGLALDDFGTGYSSLSHLRNLPIDTLKIDRSFIQRVDCDACDAALVGSIIGMAKVLGLRVVVEGVETEDQRDVLRNLGCDEIQGYLFSRPLDRQAVTELLQQQHGEIDHPRRTPAGTGC